MLIFYSILLLSVNLNYSKASRAYPHGCLYHHPYYYTYDEREDISWADGQFRDVETSHELGRHVDFRVLPPKSSRLRRSYQRYRLTRRLGAGKFSEVYEAVDLEHVHVRGQAESQRVVARYDGDSTDGSTETDDETVMDYDSLVVLKCLKPISERKVRRELLVLTHCATLPNLARLIGIALPESIDTDENISSSSQPEYTKKRRRRSNKLQKQQVDLGSITDAAATIERNQKKTCPKQCKNQNGETLNNHQLPSLVLEHAGIDAKWFCHGPRLNNNTNEENGSDYLTEREMKYYLCHLLIALDSLHSVGIMHRDVKPRNCLINFASSQDKDSHHNTNPVHESTTNTYQSIHLPPPPLMLVDLGLADFYLPGKEYNVRVASRHYKSPELLIGFSYYDYAIDMWSVGCILAGLLFRREPFFRGKDNEDQLGKIVSVLGTRDFLPYVRKCNVKLTSGMRASIGKYCSVALSGDKDVTSSNVARRKPWLTFLTPTCPIPSSEALDILDKLLVYDHEQRWTAREALGHSFFDEVRDDVLREVQQRMLWESQWQARYIQKR